MKSSYIIWGILVIGTLTMTFNLANLEKEIAAETNPKFDYINWEMPPDRDYSQRLYASIHGNGMTAKVQETLNKDFWYILLYVSSSVVGALLLLQYFEVKKQWIYILIALLGVTAGVCDYVENGNLEMLLSDWDAAATAGSVEKAANFAKVKFGIILPLIGGTLLGWFFVLGKKIFGKS